jgi:hypothetical protein
MFPREHGAWSMLLTPFAAAVLLSRRLSWAEPVALAAVLAAFLAKEPLIALARQRFVWKQPRPESAAALRWLAVEALVLALCGLLLVSAWPWPALAALGASAAAFSALAVFLTIHKRQRAPWFQIASAAALTSSSLAACLSALGRLPSWCWLLWASCALQAAAGILVVHARLDALVASRKSLPPPPASRRAAFSVLAVFPLASGALVLSGRAPLAAVFALPLAASLFELRRQLSPLSLRMPLRTAGLQAMSLSLTFTALLTAALWPG